MSIVFFRFHRFPERFIEYRAFFFQRNGLSIPIQKTVTAPSGASQLPGIRIQNFIG
jgi:hypothetical protein